MGADGEKRFFQWRDTQFRSSADLKHEQIPKAASLWEAVLLMQLLDFLPRDLASLSEGPLLLATFTFWTCTSLFHICKE